MSSSPDETVEAFPDDRPFDPYRCPRSEKARAVVADVLTQLQNYERHRALRKRARKATDQEAFETAVSTIVCNLIHHHLTGTPGDTGIYVTRSNQVLGQRSRYRPVAYGKTLPKVLDELAAPEMAFVTMDMGYQGYFGPARRTTIRAGERLVSRIEDYGLRLEDLGKENDGEVIILRRAKVGFWDEGDLIEYEDTEQTRRYRSEVQTINRWLAEAEIDFDSDAASRAVDVSDRRLRRHFTQGSFESGGRLFGGFWQALRKRERFAGLHIDQSAIATLDYAQMAPRILYGIAGKPPPDGDAYDLGDPLRMPRDGVKKVLNSMLFAAKPLDRMPKGTRQLFAASVGIGELVDRINDRHQDIAHLFCTGIGHRQQFIESEILVDVLLALKQVGIVGLPVHDAVIVPHDRIDETRRIMEQAFEDHTGHVGLVGVEEG
jgi:hypothetical protein